MRYLNDVALSGANTATISGPAIDAQGLFRASVQAVFGDTTLAGTLKLQGSNDAPSATGPTHWSDAATATVSAGALTLVPATELSYRYIRVSLTVATPGTSTVIATLNALGQ